MNVHNVHVCRHPLHFLLTSLRGGIYVRFCNVQSVCNFSTTVLGICVFVCNCSTTRLNLKESWEYLCFGCSLNIQECKRASCVLSSIDTHCPEVRLLQIGKTLLNICCSTVSSGTRKMRTDIEQPISRDRTLRETHMTPCAKMLTV